jgi:hypothetical protein
MLGGSSLVASVISLASEEAELSLNLAFLHFYLEISLEILCTPSSVSVGRTWREGIPLIDKAVPSLFPAYSVCHMYHNLTIFQLGFKPWQMLLLVVRWLRGIVDIQVFGWSYILPRYVTRRLLE